MRASLKTSDAESLLQKECAVNHVVKVPHTAKTQSTGDRDKGASRFAAAFRARQIDPRFKQPVATSSRP
jgi:hypothetical protein